MGRRGLYYKPVDRTNLVLDLWLNGVKLVQLRGECPLGRTKGQKNGVRLSVTLDESEYAELGRLAASLDLSAAWMIRRAVSEFIARYRAGIESDLPLRLPGAERADHYGE